MRYAPRSPRVPQARSPSHCDTGSNRELPHGCSAASRRGMGTYNGPRHTTAIQEARAHIAAASHHDKRCTAAPPQVTHPPASLRRGRGALHGISDARWGEAPAGAGGLCLWGGVGRARGTRAAGLSNGRTLLYVACMSSTKGDKRSSKKACCCCGIHEFPRRANPR